MKSYQLKLWHEGELLGSITTDRTNWTIWEAIDFLGIDIDEVDGGIPVYDVEAFEITFA